MNVKFAVSQPREHLSMGFALKRSPSSYAVEKGARLQLRIFLLTCLLDPS